MTEQNFINGAFTLMTAGVIVKALGFFYQIVIVRIVGTEGIGIFNMVYPLYTMAMVLTCAGIPAAIVRLSPEYRRLDSAGDGRSLLRMAETLLTLSTATITGLLILISPTLMRYLYQDPRVIPPFLLLLPSLLLAAVSSAIRAYFQGNRDMRPTAGAQLLEQITRVITGLGLAWIMAPYGMHWTLIAMAAGVLCSEFAGFFYLWWRFSRQTRERNLLQRPSKDVSKAIYRFGLPLTVTRLLLSASNAAEAMVLPARLLTLGLTASQSAAFYGQVTGVVFPLLNIPSILTGSVSTAIIPAIAEAQSRKDYNLMTRRIIQALGLTLLIGIPISVFLYYFGPVLASVLFHVKEAGPLVQWLAPAGLFLWLSQLSSGILQGMGLVVQGSINTLISCSLRLFCLWYFTTAFSDYSAGVCAAYILSFVTNALLNLILIRRHSAGWFKAGLASCRTGLRKAQG